MLDVYLRVPSFVALLTGLLKEERLQQDETVVIVGHAGMYLRPTVLRAWPTVHALLRCVPTVLCA